MYYAQKSQQRAGWKEQWDPFPKMLLLRNRTTIIKRHEKIFGMDLGLPPSPFVFRFCLAAKATFLGVWLQMRRRLLAS